MANLSGNMTIDSALNLYQRERSRSLSRQSARSDERTGLADFLCRVRAHDVDGIAKHYYPEVAKSGNLSELKGPEGGYLVPPELSADVLRDLSTGSLFRRYGAYVHPMASETETLPTVAASLAHAAGVSPYFGGLQFQWIADNTTLPKTSGGFHNLELKANVLAGYLYASNPLIDDADGLEEWLGRIVSGALAWTQDAAFFSGTGAGQPQGVTHAPATLAVTRATGGQIVLADAQAMLDALLPQAYDNAVWFTHPSTMKQITSFTGWIPNGPLQLFGRPLVPTGKCATLGSRGDLILMDPRIYVIGDRLQLEIAYSRHEPTAMLANKSAFRVWSRVAGQPMIDGPITEMDGTTQVSPIVVLNSNPPTS